MLDSTQKEIVTVYKDYMITRTYQENSQPTFTSLKPTQETMELEAKYIQS